MKRFALTRNKTIVVEAESEEHLKELLMDVFGFHQAHHAGSDVICVHAEGGEFELVVRELPDAR